MNSIPLEEIVKNNLASYEARYDANDWSRMENMLGTTTDSSPFNWKPVLIVFGILVVLAGGYALFTTVDFSKKTEEPAVSAPTPPVVKKTITPAVKKVIPPPVTPVAPLINQDSLKQAEEAAAIAKAEEERMEMERMEKERRREKEKISDREKEPEIKKEKKELSKEELELKRARRRALAETDSGKTNDGTKEKNKDTEKKEKTKSSSSFGLNIFSTLNADSLKKYQEKSKKDSVK